MSVTRWVAILPVLTALPSAPVISSRAVRRRTGDRWAILTVISSSAISCAFAARASVRWPIAGLTHLRYVSR